MKNKLYIKDDSIINNYMLQQLAQENPEAVIDEDSTYDVVVDGIEVPKNHAKIILAAYLSDPSCDSGVLAALNPEGSQYPSLDYINRNLDLFGHFKHELTLKQDICCKYGSYLGMSIMQYMTENLESTHKITQTMDNFSQLNLDQKEQSKPSEQMIKQESDFQESFTNAQYEVSLKVSKLTKMINLLSNNDDPELSGMLTIIARTLVENLNQGSISIPDQDLSTIACMIYYRANEKAYEKFCNQATQKLSLGSANIQKLIEFTNQISTKSDLLQPVDETTKLELLCKHLVEKIEEMTTEYRQKQAQNSDVVEVKGTISNFLSQLAFESPQEEKTYVIQHLSQPTKDLLLGDLFAGIFDFSDIQ